MLDSLDGDAVRRWCATGLAGLRRHQHEIDQLNVYPVPDGDTGTNLVLTLAAAADHLQGAPDRDLGGTMSDFARGALLGARGNSGVIVSQLLAGFAETCQRAVVTGRGLAAGLTAAAESAYRAVADPVEGTILSVARAAGLAATATDSDDLGKVAAAAVNGAADALARTPDQLPELARAGVVDAGGRGLVVLLEALVEVITGEPPPAAAFVPANPRPPVMRETGSTAYAFEVQFLLDAPGAEVETLRRRLALLGDSLVIVGTGPMGATDETGAPVPTWNVHVHVNDVGAVIEAGLAAGRPHRISVSHFAEQIAARSAQQSSQPGAEQIAVTVEWETVTAAEITEVGTPVVEVVSEAVTEVVTSAGAHLTGVDAMDVLATGEIAVPASMTGAKRTRRATVVVATGDGLATLFREEGAAVVAGPSPSTGEILGAVLDADAARVVVLPNAAATQGAASAAAAEARKEGIRVSVVPTRSPVQVLAALAVRDEERRFEDDVIAMAEAAGACRYAEVTWASREALTVAGRCQPGDVLGLVEGEVNLIGKDLVETCRDLLDRMLAGGGELVTLITGAQAPGDLAGLLQEHLTRKWPFVEAQVYHGGQPYHPLLVGVE